MGISVVIIDSRVTDYQTLIDGLSQAVEVLVLNSESDGVSQIATYLQGRSGIDALHIFSHGSEGALYLGSTVLDSGNLSTYESHLASIGIALTETGDILLYGRNVAQGEGGQWFITCLAQYTVADVAGSGDRDADAALGVYWQTVGGIDAKLLVNSYTLELLDVNATRSLITTDFGGAPDWGYNVTVQSDGKILVAGSGVKVGGHDDNFALARYNTNGTLDTSFATDGKLTTDFAGSDDAGYSLAVQSDGKILMAGSTADGNGNYDFALARYNTNGTLDTSFNTDGKLTTDFTGSNDVGSSVTVQSDGKILVAGSAVVNGNPHFALARYNTDGTLDISFGTDGKVTTDVAGYADWGNSVTVQSEGKILVAGSAVDVNGNYDFALARYNTNGTLDTSFDTDGKLTTDFAGSYDAGSGVTVQSDGKILVAGSASDVNGNNDFALVRYNTNGSLDTSFGAAGKLTTDFAGSNDFGSSVAVQFDGKILVAGSASPANGDPDFALARYNTNGTLDTTFDTDGRLTTDFAGSYDTGSSVTVQSDGKILVAGNTVDVFGNSDFALVRYNTAGSLDSSFSASAPKTGQALVQEATLHLGQDYSYNITPGQSAYANASYAGPWDCSEFVSWLVGKVYDKQIGLRDWNAYTGYWAQDATAGTLLHTISLTDARNTPGAIIYRFDDGLHHIAISEGNGKLIEANVNFHNGYYWSDNGTAYAPLANGNPPSGVDIGDVRERNFDITTYSAAAGWAAVEINGVSYTTTPVTDVPPGPGADDFAASTATTGVLSLAAPATGTIELAGDKDWFKIDNLVAGHNYQITVQGTGTTPLADTFFSLRNAAGAVVIGSASRSGGQAYDDAGPGTDALVQFTADANGTHYVAVGGGGANFADLTGGYRVVLTEVSDPGATRASAGAIVLDAAPTAGFVGYGADSEDYYTFVAPSNGTVTTHLTGVDVKADLDARLMSSAGSPLGTAGDNPSTTVTAGQTYYVEVTPHNSYAFGDQSPYSIDVDFVATAPVDPAVPKNAASLFGDAKLATLANFALAAYDIQSWEPVAIGAFKNDIKPGAHSAFTSVIGADLWHAVELQTGVLPIPDPTRPTDFQFGFEAGVFTNKNAAALVARSSDALVISFRGTNDNDAGMLTADHLPTEDEASWFNMNDHYALLKDLIDQIDAYVADSASGIKKVYVVGHSLGAALVDKFMAEPKHQAGFNAAVTYEAVEFAHPDVNNAGAAMVAALGESLVRTAAGGPLLFAPNVVADLVSIWATARAGVPNFDSASDPRIVSFHNDTDIINFADFDNKGLIPGDENNLVDGISNKTTSHSMLLYRGAIDFLTREGVSIENISSSDSALDFDRFVYTADPVTDVAGDLIGFSFGVGSNTLYGSLNADVLLGGPGNDVLIGDVGNDLLMGGDNNDTYRFFAESANIANVIFLGNDTIVDTGGTDSIEIVGIGFVGIGVKELQAKKEKNGDVTITIKASFNTSATITIKNYFGKGHIENLCLGSVRTTIDDLLAGNTLADPNVVQIVANAGAIAAHIAADAAVVAANATLTAAQLAAATAEAAAQAAANAALEAAQAAAAAVVASAELAANAAKVAGTLVADGIRNAAIKVTLGVNAILEWTSPFMHSYLGEAFTPPDNDSVIGIVQSISGFVNVIGTDGDDEIIGDDNGNTLTGGAGNDLVQGGGGDDFLIGGSGAGNDTYQGGDGIDTVVYTSATQGIVVNLAAVVDQASGPEIGVDQITGIENVIGGQGDDSITGDGAANALSGESGNDSLVGGSGNDTLVGGPGDDNLDGGEGIDTAVFSGAFADYVLTSTPTGWTLTGPDGRDTLARLEFARFADQLLSLGNFALAGTVTVSGTLLQGQTLTANTATLTDVDGLGTFSYQWKADSVAVDGATGATLLLTQPQVGKAITVAVSYTDGHGTVESVGSTPTTLVANVNDAPVGSVTIAGTVTQGQTLTATNTLTDLDGIGTISYQWSANGARIGGATNSTLTLGQAQVGKTISVTASYADGFGTAESMSSNATGTVVSINHAPTFAPLVGTGIVTTDIANGSLDLAYHMDLQSDGKILVAGIVEPTAGSDFALVRYNADGSLDQTFHGTGIATLDFGGTGVGEGASAGVFQLSDGKIVVGGNNFVDFALARYNADGSLDTSFGTNGKVTTAIGFGYDIGIGMVVQPNGKILLSGWSTIGANDDFSLVRYSADGTLDSGFGSGGKVTTDFGGWDSGYSVALQADGKIVMSGQHHGAGNDFAVARYTSTGSLDPSFGAGGKVTTDFGGGNDFGSALIVQFDGKIVVAGGVTVGGNSNFGLVRYNTDGSVDTTFGSAGKVTTDFGGTEGVPQSGLAQQADGKLLVLGTSTINGVTSLALSRYNTDGSLDVTFSADGKTLFSTGFGDTYGHSIKLRSDGKILISCSVVNSASNYDFAVVRFNSDGSLDTSFGAATGVGNTLGGTISYTEHTSAVALDTSVAVLDSDLAALVAGAGDYNGAIVALARVGGANPEDQFSALTSSHLSFTGGNALLSGTVVGSVVNSNGSLSITFNHGATQAVVNEVLSSIAYANSSSAASSAVQIGWTFSDGNTGTQGTGGALQDTGTTSVNVVYAAVPVVNHAPTFAPLVGTGIVTTDIRGNGSTDSGDSAAAMSNGKIVVAGSSFNQGTGRYDFAVVRYNTDGTLDTSFGIGGKLTTHVSGSGSDDRGQGVTVTSDDKIIVVGTSRDHATFHASFDVVRYNSDGSLDTSFGAGGMVTSNFNGNGSFDAGKSVKVSADGKIVVVGYTQDNTTGDRDFAVMRYNGDGTLDASFGISGKVSTNFGVSNDEGGSVTLTADNKIIVAGFTANTATNDRDFAVVRYNNNGSLDTSFGNAGRVTTDISGNGSGDYGTSVTLTAAGKIVVAGYTDGFNFAVVRYNNDGTLDSSFGTGGKVATSVSGAGYGVSLTSDGKIVVAGGSTNATGQLDFAVLRYNSDGTLDSSFGAGGKVVTNASENGAHDIGSSVLVASDDRIIVIGMAQNGSDDFAIVRYNTDGSLDTSFGSSVGMGNTLGGTISYTEHTAAVALDSSVAILDSDLTALAGGVGDYNGASLSLARVGGANAQDQFSALDSSHLTFTAGNAVLSNMVVGTFTTGNGGLSITFNHNATQAAVNEILSSIAYANSSSAASSTVQIGWTFSDGNTGAQGTGGALTALGSTNVNVVVAANTAPTITLPGNLTFSTNADFATGSGPRSVTSADVNGDGKVDLIVANTGGSNVSVLLGDGLGGFATKADFATGSGPISVTSADVNGDGLVDLIAANIYSDSVSVLLGNGAGGFAAKTDFATGRSPSSVTSTDVNGDGKLDLMVANSISSSVSVLLGNGAGSFAAKVDFTTGSSPFSVTSADVNGDGKLDLIVANSSNFSNSVSVLLGNGAGSFAAKTDFTTGTAPVSVTSADVNGDGLVALIVATYGSNSVSVLLGNGAGSFAAKTDFAAGTDPISVTSADLNGDGLVDLIVGNFANPSVNGIVSVLLGDGKGGFTAKTDFDTGAMPASVASADVNGDGKLDLIVANTSSFSNSVSVLLNDRSNGFIEQTPVAAASGISITDADGDADWIGGSLKAQITASNEAADTLYLPGTNPGGSAIWLDASGNKLMAGGTQIGSADAASVTNGTVWTLSFNASATNALVQATGRALLFNNSSDTPGTSSRTITLTVTDKYAAASSATQTITVAAANDAPTLTTLGTLTGGTQDTQKAISFADLQTAGNEADVDGTVTAFVVKAVSTGTLKIGTSADAAAAWAAGSNDTVDPTHSAYWTSAPNASGTLNAFTAVAKDNAGLESSAAIQASVSVATTNPVTPVAPAVPATIGAATPTADQIATEGGNAVATYHLSAALTSATTVKVSVNGQGGATQADYSGFSYHLGASSANSWFAVPASGLIIINAGAADFQLKVTVAADNIMEAGEALAFAVAQTTSSVGLTDSWWVPSIVQLQDAVAIGAKAIPRSITASTTTPADEPSSAAGNVNHAAVATYNLSGAGTDYASTEVHVNLYGLGGATTADYNDFAYRMGASGAWISVPASGLITVDSTAAAFQLSANVLYDTLSESNEALSFNVAQTTSSVGLTDSWWVPTIVGLQDAVGTGARAIPRSIAASATTPADEPSSAAGNVNHAAIATYNLSGAGTGYASTEVRLSLYGLGGATPADYSDFAYRMGTSGAWISVPASGLITVGSTAAAFQLSANVLYDTLSESNEALSFNVAQTNSSVGLTDSWWVPSIVGLADAIGHGASALPRSITATSTTTAIEASSSGNNANHAAVATYNLSGSGAGYASTEVHVKLDGQGGATLADYSDFSYRMGTSGTWISVPASGLITIGSSDGHFQLSANVLYDTRIESNEVLSFTVAQTTSSIGLVDSWWVQSVVNLADADPDHGVFTGAVGSDHFTATPSLADTFVIPTGSSVALTGRYDTIVGIAVTDGDRIDVPGGILVSRVVWSGVGPDASPTAEAAWVNALGTISTYAPGELHIYRNSIDAYIWVNDDGNTAFNVATDTFIKLVGSASLSDNQIASLLI